MSRAGRSESGTGENARSAVRRDSSCLTELPEIRAGLASPRKDTRSRPGTSAYAGKRAGDRSFEVAGNWVARQRGLMGGSLREDPPAYGH